MKKRFEIDVIAGNVATAEGAKALVEAGADAVKVGIGPGSICTTRVISGVGVPQITAICQAARASAGSGVPIIADGGIRYSGDITKAIGRRCHMRHARRLAGRTGGKPRTDDHLQGPQLQDLSRHGLDRGDGRRFQRPLSPGPTAARGKLVPEGVEGRVPYKGNLAPFVYQLVGGLRAGMGYCGTRNIEELRTRSRFIMVSGGVGAGEPSA